MPSVATADQRAFAALTEPERLALASEQRRFSAHLAAPTEGAEPGIRRAVLYAGESVPRHPAANPSGVWAPWSVRFAMEPRACVMTRLVRGVVLTAGHVGFSSVADSIGRTVEGTATISDDGLVADVRLADAADVRADLQHVIRQAHAGILRELSVDVVDWTLERAEAEDVGAVEAYVATSWEVGALALVVAGASAGAHLESHAPGREPVKETQIMDLDKKTPEQLAADKTAEHKALVAAERERINGIQALAAMPACVGVAAVKALAVEATAGDMTIEQFRGRAFEALAGQPGQQNIDGRNDSAHVQMGADLGAEGMRLAVADALAAKLSPGKALTAGKQFRGAALLDIMREASGLKGYHTPEEIFRASFAPAAHTRADFPAIFADVAQNRLRARFEADPSYLWFQTVGSRNDFASFEPQRRSALKGFPVLSSVAEGGAYQGITVADAYETSTPTKNGNGLALTIEMVAGDRIGAFSARLDYLAAAGARTVSGRALTEIGTKTMSDGKALYHADHGNLGTSGVPTAARLNALETLLRSALDGTVGVGMPMGYLFAAPTLRETIEGIFKLSERSLTGSDLLLTAPERIYPPDLSGVAYYGMAADPSALEWGWWSQDGGPRVIQDDSPNTDSVNYLVRVAFDVCATKYQRFAMNVGVGA